MNTKDVNIEEKERILSFAGEYYLREGFYKTPMDTIASELRMSKKTIYKYFPSKEVLVEKVIENMMARVQADVNRIISEETDAVSKLKMLHEVLGGVIVRFSDKWMNDMRIHAPGLWKKVDEFRTKKMFSIFSIIFEQGKKEGYFHDKPVEILLTVVTSSLRAVINPEFLYFNKFSYSDAVNYTFDILFNGFLTGSGKKIYERKLEEK
jgi:AcrR family transcriptional regulator